MKPAFKPYRLINDPELKILQQDFDSKLQCWNDEHAIFPLTCRLDPGPTQPVNDDFCWAKAQPVSYAEDLSIIQHSLFGEQSPCFNALTETLFKNLLNQLFGTQPLDDIEDWFYHGTPSLTLTFSCTGKTMTLYLHPQWVLNTLTSNNTARKPITTLHNALATQPIDLHVELNPLPLKLADILRLNVGDMIKTDHPITKPAQLSHQQKRICTVDIGASNPFKSIQITGET